MNRKNDRSLIFKIAIIIIDIAALALFFDIIIGKGKDGTQIILPCAALAVFCIAVTALVFFIEKKAHFRYNGEEISMLNNVTLDFIQTLKTPVLITDADGNTVWFNDALPAVFTNSPSLQYGDNISNLTEGLITAADLLKGEPIDVKVCDVHYIVTPYSVELDGRLDAVAVFEDKTEIDSVTEELKMKNPVVSFIVVDNLGDIYSNLQEKNRDASNKVAAILNKCAEDIHALIKEYERDRYVMVFEYKYLIDFAEKKFDILDEIRDATASDSDVPITISIGVACDENNLSDKVNSAKQALELALQRGGDQAVVKYSQNMEIYGGRSKTVQKRSKLRSRVIVSELELQMKKCSNVLIMGHKQADHDAIGASVGIARIAMHCGIKANIVCDLNDTNYRSIISEIHSKPDYYGYFVDGVTGLELLQANTLVVAVDVNNVQLMEEPELFLNAENTVVIDHHRKSSEFDRQPVISYIEPSVSSTCELISEMLEQFLASGELMKEEADILLSGIWLDTSQFSKNAGVRTFGAAQYLRGEGASPAQTALLFKQSLSEVIGEAKFESNVAIYLDHIAISAVKGECEPSDKISAAKAANKLINIKDIVASFVLYKTNGTINISARSNGNINVALILEKMGGGGHFDMAGAQVSGDDMNTVLRLLKDKIDEYMLSEQEARR